jgi:cytochrome P450
MAPDEAQACPVVASSDFFSDLAPHLVRCPYEFYRALRQQPPAWVDEIEAYVVSRFADIRAVLHDTETFSSRTVQGPVPLRRRFEVLGAIAAENPGLAARLMEGVLRRPMLLTTDGEEHQRLRSLVNKAFTTRRIMRMQPQIQSIATRLIDSFIERHEVEFISEFAAPLPLRVIASVIGVPDHDVNDFKRWSDDLFAPQGVNQPTKEMITALARSSHEFIAYFNDRIDERRQAPTDDILSDLVRAEEDGHRLSRSETLVICSELLAAGNETTTSLIAQTVLTLAQRPDLTALMQAEPERIPALIEETLRLETPIQGFYRTATVDAAVGGVMIPAGAHLFLIYASGNRDERHFADPDDLDLDREPRRDHLAFGRGAHVCLGSLLARTEARIALEVLLGRVENLQLSVPTESLGFMPSHVVRRLTSLPLRLDPRAVAEAGRRRVRAKP